MLVNNIRRTITDDERDEVIAEFAQRLSSTGPFPRAPFRRGRREAHASRGSRHRGIDTAYTTRLVVLDPAQFSLRNGSEQSTSTRSPSRPASGRARRSSPCSGPRAACLLLSTPSAARTHAGWRSSISRGRRLWPHPRVQADDELKATGTKELAAAKEQLEKAIKRAFQHVAYLAQPDPEGERQLEQVTFDDEHSTSLDGTIVWKALAERDKVFDAGHFSAKALVHNLRDGDYGRTLSDLRAAFYSAPGCRFCTRATGTCSRRSTTP